MSQTNDRIEDESGHSRDRAQDAFLRALRLPPAERDTFVQTSTLEENDRKRVLAMLRHADSTVEGPDLAARTGRIPFEAVGGSAHDFAAAQDAIREVKLPERIGTTFDGYTLVGEIGAGGYGVVYAAEQREPARQVAIKIIKLGMDTLQVLTRFEQEREALAMMDHPGIAKVFDAGATPSGRPYIVMELVKGQPITALADEEKLTIRDRLMMFIHVCEAVQHAHVRGIIHRDLTPRNILASRSQEHGKDFEIKVIDFGVCKVIQPELSGDNTLTAPNQGYLGTAAYMSPEHLPGSRSRPDARSDVYSLGVILYELLTGCSPNTQDNAAQQWPFAKKQLAAPFLPSRHNALLKGDLDAILCRTLDPDPEARPQSALSLEEHIKRYLGNQPCSLRTPGVFYRLGKLYRRRPLATIATFSAAISLMVGLSVLAWALQRARAAEQRAAAAVLQLQEELWQQYYTGAAPLINLQPDRLSHAVGVALPPDVVAKALDDTVLTPFLQWLRTNSQELKAGAFTAMLSSTADAYEKLKVYDKAEPLYREVIVLREQQHDSPAQQSDICAAKASLAHLLVSTERAAEAEPLARDAVEHLRREPDPKWKTGFVGTLNILARVRQELGQYASGEELCREALGVLEELGATDTPPYAMTLSTHGECLYALGRDGQSQDVFARAAAIFRPYGANAAVLVASAETGQARSLIRLGRLDDAERLLEAAKKMTDFPTANPRFVKSVHMGVAELADARAAESGLGGK